MEYNSEKFKRGVVSLTSVYVFFFVDIFSALLCPLFFELVGGRHVTSLVGAVAKLPFPNNAPVT